MNESAVCLTGHTGRDHGTADVVDPKTKAKATRCKKFTSITCDDHEAASGQARAGGGFEFQYLPQSYVVDPEGKTLADLPGAFAKKQGIEKLKEASKKLGPGMSSSAWAKAQAALGEGDSALSSGDLKKALDRYRSAGREKGATKALEASVAAKVSAVETRGLQEVEAAKGESDPAVAKRKLQAIAQDLAGTKAAEAARAAIVALG
ncbi:MAG: hypothetical protein ACREIU_12075 [Planctomycetota bacterium]